jgi:hypothetical protein
MPYVSPNQMNTSSLLLRSLFILPLYGSIVVKAGYLCCARSERPIYFEGSHHLHNYERFAVDAILVLYLIISSTKTN